MWNIRTRVPVSSMTQSFTGSVWLTELRYSELSETTAANLDRPRLLELIGELRSLTQTTVKP